MIVTGEHLLGTTNAKKLFAMGSEWIQKRFNDDGREVISMTIEEKTIGRNEGFNIVVCVQNPFEIVKYFAKIQTPHVETVITHFLLEITASGPAEFYTVLLEPAFRYGWYYVEEHGVITREIRDWRMASTRTEQEIKDLWNNEQMKTDSFLLTLLILLGRFGNIPGNRDNWGLVHTDAVLDSPVSTPRMMLVDFSSAGRLDRALMSRFDFHVKWSIFMPLASFRKLTCSAVRG